MNIASHIYNLLLSYTKEGTIVYRDYNIINAHKNEFITIIKDNTLLACCGLRTHASCWELYAFAVSKDYKGQGLGKELLHKVESTMQGRLIALSKFKGEWFISNGFTQITPNELPKEIIYNTVRSPSIFSKHVD